MKLFLSLHYLQVRLAFVHPKRTDLLKISLKKYLSLHLFELEEPFCTTFFRKNFKNKKTTYQGHILSVTSKWSYEFYFGYEKNRPSRTELLRFGVDLGGFVWFKTGLLWWEYNLSAKSLKAYSSFLKVKLSLLFLLRNFDLICLNLV